MGRAQVSVEYLVIVGVALGLLVPAVLFFALYNRSNEASSVSDQVNAIGLESISTVKSTYALGKNARQTIEFTMPDAVRRVYIGGAGDTELIFVYETSVGVSEAVFFSNVQLETPSPDHNVSAIHPGVTRYQFESTGSTVNITEAGA